MARSILFTVTQTNPDEIEVHLLSRALAFYRAVGATLHVREGEALLAASA